MNPCVGYHQWRCGKPARVPEALFIDMGQVNHDPQAVAGFDQFPAGFTQIRSRVK